MRSPGGSFLVLPRRVSKFRNGQSWNAHCAIVARHAIFTTLMVGVDIPPLLRKEVWESMDGKLDFSRKSSRLATLGAEVPIRSNAMGHYVLDSVPFGARLNLGPKMSPSHTTACAPLGTSLPERRPSSSGNGLADSRDGQRLRLTPLCLQACRAVMRIDVLNLNVQDARGGARKFH